MKKQGGFTIVELMVGLMLSIILAFAVGAVYTQTRKSFKLQTSQTRLIEQGRYAIAVFQKMVTQAGYRNETSVTSTTIADTTLFSGTVIASGASSTTKFLFTGNAASSPIVIIKCDGTDYTSDAVITNTLGKSGSKLICNNGSDDVELLSDNVVDFGITYGEDTSTTKDKIPDVYTSSPSDFKNVYAAKMCIVLKGDDISGNTQDTTATYIDCSGNSQTASDKRLYRRFDTTVYLRNRFD